MENFMSRNGKCFIALILCLSCFFFPHKSAWAQVAPRGGTLQRVSTPRPAPTPSETWISINESVHQDLFGVPFDPSTHRYEFGEEILDLGLYAGVTYDGYTFDLDVIFHEPFDFTVLTPAEQVQVASRQMNAAHIFGVLTSPTGAAAIKGMVLSQVNPDNGAFESGLVVNQQFDLDDPIIEILSLDPPSSPVTGGGGGATQPTQPNPIPPSPIPGGVSGDYDGFPTTPTADQVAAFRQLYLAAFGVSAAPHEVGFSVGEEIVESGVYEGVTAQGLPFTTHLTSFVPVTSSEIGFDAVQAAELDALGNTFALVSGTLNGEPFAGVASNTEGVGTLAVVAVGEIEIGIGDSGVIIWVPVKITVPDTDCILDCYDTWGPQIDAAQALIDEAAADEATADLIYDAAVAAVTGAAAAAGIAAAAAYTAAAAACLAAYAKLTITCILLLASFWGTLAGIACMAAAAATVALCEAAAIAALGVVTQAIKATYDAGIAAAEQAKTDAYADAALKRAQGEADLAAATEGLADCIEGCTICILIWIPIFIFFF